MLIEKDRRILRGMKTGNTILWDVVFMYVLSFVTLLMPYAAYTYKKVRYVVTGAMFLSGTTIQKGAITIGTQVTIVWVVALWAVGMLLAVLFPRFKKVKIPGMLLVADTILIIGFHVFLSLNLDTVMGGAKGAASAYGLWIAVVIAVYVFCRMLQIFYAHNVLTALDFMVMPGALYLLVNNYFPMIGIFIAFKNIDYSKGIFASEWVGFSNFKYLFATEDAFIMTRNTLLYNLAFIIIGNIMGIAVAIMLNEIVGKRLKKLFQTTILLPQLISIIIVAYIGYAFLSSSVGLINKVFLKDSPISFYNSPQYWPFILIFVNTWKGLGYSSIIYLSAIVGINKDLYEAAYLDGAGKIKQVFSITLPLLKPTFITLMIMSMGRIFFSDFGLFFQVPKNSGALFPVTQTIDTYVYRALMQLNNLSMASAASVFQSVVGFIVVILVNGIIRKIDNENAMF